MAGPLPAQIDCRNLDDERPLLSEDAYPIERYAAELLVPYRYEAEAGDERVHASVLELGYGIADNTQLGVHVPFAVVDAVSGSEAATRRHLSALRSVGPEDALSAAEPAPRWTYSAALDRTVFRHSLLLAAEVVASRTVRAAPIEVNARAGIRWQWTPTLVLHVGISRRLRETGPDPGLTVGPFPRVRVARADACAREVIGVAKSLRHPLRRLALGLLAGLALQAPAAAQEQRDGQFYYPGSFNWKFLNNYPEGARLFNAFDYGHAVLYETLYTPDDEAPERSLENEYRYLTTDLLIRPPRIAIAKDAVMPRCGKLAWRAKQKGVPQVQRADLGLSLAPGRPERAVHRVEARTSDETTAQIQVTVGRF